MYPSGDYKFDMQMIAEELAEERYGKDFYELSPDQQYETFNDAAHRYSERACDRADYLRKAARENG
jgi:hypothetical protein